MYNDSCKRGNCIMKNLWSMPNCLNLTDSEASAKFSMKLYTIETLNKQNQYFFVDRLTMHTHLLSTLNFY